MTTTMRNPKFYVARQDERFFVQPQPQQSALVVARDGAGYWAHDPQQGWYKSALSSYVLVREIPESEALALVGQWPESDEDREQRALADIAREDAEHRAYLESQPE